MRFCGLSFAFVLALLMRYLVLCTDGNLVDQYYDLIQNELNKSATYKLPVDFKQYEPIDPDLPPQDYGTFTFVVIGCGTTGSVISNRLVSRFKNSTILVLEAGTSFGDNFTQIPIYNYVNLYSDYNYGFYTEAQQYSCQGMKNKQCTYPRGKGVGGTTLINGLVYARANKEDYNRWGRANPGWSYQDILPLLKMAENATTAATKQNPNETFAKLDRNLHGYNGRLHTEINGPYPHLNPQVGAFIKAHEELGVGLTNDYNGRRQMGVATVQVNTNQGRRDSHGSAYSTKSKRLRLLTGAFVTKIHLVGKRAVSVEFTHGGVKFAVRADREIILSAGVVGSAHLLLLSGVGPPEQLKSHGLPVVQSLPVGRSFQDHVAFIGMCLNSNVTEPNEPLTHYIAEFLHGAINSSHFSPRTNAVSFLSVNSGNEPDLELVLTVGGNVETSSAVKTLNLEPRIAQLQCGSHPEPFKTFSIGIVALKPYSVGTIELRTGSAYDFPAINPNSLSDGAQSDIESLYLGVRMVFKLLETDAFRRINVTFAGGPIPECDRYRFPSKNYWYCAIRQMAMPAFHGVASCPMGTVVNDRLKVFGTENLRVADSSVIPFPLSGHPSATCTIIGEQLVRFLQEDYGTAGMRN